MDQHSRRRGMARSSAGLSLVELLVYAAATIVWWTSGSPWVGLAFAVVAVTAGLVAGRRRLP